MNLRQIGEDRLLAQLDAAAIAERIVRSCWARAMIARSFDRRSADDLLLLKTDCVVEGIHFARATTLRFVGWKAMMRPLSDFAAMSGVPQFALVTLIAPATENSRLDEEALSRTGEAAREIRGGRSSAAKRARHKGPAVISVSLTGFVEKRSMGRRAAEEKARDELFVTGPAGRIDPRETSEVSFRGLKNRAG